VTIQLQWGFTEVLRLPVAALIYDTFFKKFQYTLGPRHKAITFIANSLQPHFGLVALRDGEFVGIAAAKTAKGELLQIRFGPWIRTYHFRAILSFLVGFPFWYEKRIPGELTLANLCVRKSARERGIGTQMIQEFMRFGTVRGYQTLKLEVINSNVRAKLLYERLGFKTTKYVNIPLPWRHLLGFTGVYEMSYPLA
jgi:ribosomal protein S18 acetylase RimI-like enzyme